MVILLKIKRRDFFSTRQHFYFGIKTRKFKLLYFRNETCYGNGNLYRDLLFVYLQPSEIRIRKSSLFWLYHLMKSLWKPSLSTLSNIFCNYPLTTTQEDHFTSCENIETLCPRCPPLSHFLGLYPSYSGLPIKSWSTLITLYSA